MGAGTWESHHAITTLMYRYTELVDAADFDGIGALFAHGGITQVGVPGMIEGPDAVAGQSPLAPGMVLDNVCAMFPILEKRINQRGGTLSGGEQQMLAIARALMSRPRLLLLDEPSLGLAPLIAKHIFNAIRELNRKDRLTVLLVEQNAFHALKLAHRGYVIVNGQITMSGSGKDLLQRPEVRAAYLEGGRH